MVGKIIVYNPDGLLSEKGYRFHGYITEYIKKYADYLFVPNPIKAYKISQVLKKMDCSKKIRVVCSLVGINKPENIIIGFGAARTKTYGMERFKGNIIFHLMDYYIDIPLVKDYLKKIGASHVIGHCQLDVECEMFKYKYPEYIGKVINLPFGYENRFRSTVSFDSRKKIAVGLGSINLMADKKLISESTEEMRVFFAGRKYQHEVRAYIRDNADAFKDVIDARFPSDEQQKDYSYDAVEMLNSYQMFINDEGFSNFPPARTYEGIACGCVMVAPISSIYSAIGFKAGINYIGYKKDDYNDLRDKISYFIKHQDELANMQKKSLELAKNFTHSKVADLLEEKIEKLF